VFELSTAVVKVDIKVIDDNLSQNWCLQCALPALMHAEILPLHDATELNNDCKLGDIHYQTEPNLSNYSESDLTMTPVYVRHSFNNWLAVSGLPFGKLLLNVRLCLQVAFLMTSDMRSSPRSTIAVFG